MIEFEKPNIECLEVDDANNYAKFVCEPLERGYGITIGNSLRRILLSSLPGSAITSVKIDGVLHEFSTIPNVVEDVPELIINLKSVCLKQDKNETKKCIDELIATLKEGLPAKEIFVSNFVNVRYTSDFAKDKKLVQYIIKKYEFYNMNTNEVQPLSFTIEHIMPESTNNKECGMIGNLLPLGDKLNSELMDKAFKYKIKKYSASQYKTVEKFVQQYQNNDEWTKEMIFDRTKEIAKKMFEMVYN